MKAEGYGGVDLMKEEDETALGSAIRVKEEKEEGQLW